MAEKTMNRTVSADRESAIKYLVNTVGLSPLQAEVLVLLRGTDLETLKRITSTFRAEAPA